jgi:DDE superfamily endonuclease
MLVTNKTKLSRKKQGLPRLLGVLRDKVPTTHPSRGGALGYDVMSRIDMLQNAAAGNLVRASSRSLRRWRRNGTHPMEMTGNSGVVKIRGMDLYNFMMYRMIYPKATADEMIRFLFDNNNQNPRLYSRKDIYVTDKILHLTRKRSSTTAHQALLPQNVARRQFFWLQMRNVSRHVLIDIDECGIFLNSCNRSTGVAFSGVRVREEGPYGHDVKFTLIMAIDTSGFKHATFTQIVGTDAVTFYNFVLGILARLAQVVPFQPKMFMWDNLSSHLSPPLINAIYNAGHSIMNRPPYSPVDGPIEYVFNEIENQLKGRLYQIANHNDLNVAMHAIITGLGANFDATFVHCGYT